MPAIEVLIKCDAVLLCRRLVASFDDYYNLANPEFEEYKVFYTSAQYNTLFQDVAVSYRIIENIALHSIYFFSSSDGLLLSITHNGTRVPSSNFIRRNMQVDEFLNILEKNGFNSLFEDQRAAPIRETIRSIQPTRSNLSELTGPDEVTTPFLTCTNVMFRKLSPAATVLIASVSLFPPGSIECSECIY